MKGFDHGEARLPVGESWPVRRHSRRASLASLVTGVLVLSGASANAAEQSSGLPSVSIEVDFEDLDLVASSTAPIRVSVDQGATITVTLLESGPSGSSLMVDDPSALVEIEHPSGTRTRFTDFDQIGDNEYRTDFIFSEAGTWRLVALPDLEDRSLLPAGTSDVVVVVEAPLVGDTSDGATLGLYLFGALVLAIVGLVLYVTRHRLPWNHSPRTPSVPHDTWWNSP